VASERDLVHVTVVHRSEDRLVLLDPGEVDDLDEVERVGRLAVLGREDAAGCGLHGRAVPPLVLGGRLGEIAVGLRELRPEVGVGATKLRPAGDEAAQREEREDGDDDDQPEGHAATTARPRASAGACPPCA
jgi:hypothetical protein